MATINLMPLVIFTGRNNPLVPLLGVLFDSWNFFHRSLARIVAVTKVQTEGGWAALPNYPAQCDEHNMQYDSGNNLLLGDLPSNSLKELSDHRILRPSANIISDHHLYMSVWDVSTYANATCVRTLRHRSKVDLMARSDFHESLLTTGTKSVGPGSGRRNRVLWACDMHFMKPSYCLVIVVAVLLWLRLDGFEAQLYLLIALVLWVLEHFTRLAILLFRILVFKLYLVMLCESPRRDCDDSARDPTSTEDRHITSRPPPPDRSQTSSMNMRRKLWRPVIIARLR
ncbi:hypothetical protein V8E54_000007 [Elaphomyces granulatus]